MKDLSKTNQELIAENSVLKKKIQELEQTLSERIWAENERNARQLTVLHETSVELTAELGLDALLHSIAERALSLIGGAACNCYLYNPQTDLLERVASAGTALVSSPKTRRRGEGMVGHVWVKGTPLLVNDYASWFGRTRAYDSFPSRALVAAPFRWGTEILGVLNIMASLPHQYTQMDVELLSLFATQAAIAIRNARIHDRMKIELAERKQAEKDLSESENKYRVIAENMTDVISIVDMNMRFTFVSPSIMRLRGFTVEEAMAQPLEQVMTPESLLYSYRTYEEEMQLESSGNADPDRFRIIELEEYRKDMTTVWVEVTLSFLRDADGRPIGMLSLTRDITKRKRAEKALKESEEKYRELVRYAPAGIYEVDYTTNRFISVNDIICEYTGYTRDELFTMNLFNLLTEESQQLMLVRLEKLMAGEELEPTVEYCIRTKGGTELWGLFNARYIYEAGILKGSTGVIYDITDRKQAEEQIYRANAFLDSIIENIPNMLFLKDAENLRFVRFNRAGEELLGYSRNDLLGKNDYDFFSKEQADHFTKKDREVLNGREVVDIPEEPLQTRSKGERTMHTKKVPLLDMKGEPEYLLGIAEDITEQKRAEKQLQQTLESLRKAVGTTIQVISSTVEARDPYTSGHQIRSADLARAIAVEMGLPQDKIEGIRMAGSIHDIGKISIPAEILSKPTKLTNLEFSLIKEHSRKGYEMLKDVESPWPLAEIVYQHHERMDGSGYPKNLKGDEILIEARILSVADVVEAMASHRPYRPGLGIDSALNEIEKNKGIFYDNAVADACLRLFREKGFNLEGT